MLMQCPIVTRSSGSLGFKQCCHYVNDYNMDVKGGGLL